MHKNRDITRSEFRRVPTTVVVRLHAAAALCLYLAIGSASSWAASSGSVGVTSRATMTISVRVPARMTLSRGEVIHFASGQLVGNTRPCAGSYGCGQNYRVRLSRGRAGQRTLVVAPE